MSAHLDTVFPRGTNVKVRREGNVLRGPGIGDDCRGLADLLAVARALNKAGVTTPGTITFVATVGEEGLGDLRGVKRLFNETLKDSIDRFVSIDGDGLGITYIAIGSARFRVTFKGPGGHSFGSFGTVNPVHALGRAIARIADFQVPTSPRTTFNVGRVGGGTSINAIASEAWMEVDLRSSDAAGARGAGEAVPAGGAGGRDAGERAMAKPGADGVDREVGMRPAGRAPADCADRAGGRLGLARARICRCRSPKGPRTRTCRSASAFRRSPSTPAAAGRARTPKTRHSTRPTRGKARSARCLAGRRCWRSRKSSGLDLSLRWPIAKSCRQSSEPSSSSAPTSCSRCFYWLKLIRAFDERLSLLRASGQGPQRRLHRHRPGSDHRRHLFRLAEGRLHLPAAPRSRARS